MHGEIKKNISLKTSRAVRVRKRLRGCSERPRLCVVKTNAHIDVQLIDDEAGVTLAAASTRSKEFKNTEFRKKNKQSGRKLGEKIANLAKEKNIKKAVFDRGPFKFHGILASLAEGAREGGLEF